MPNTRVMDYVVLVQDGVMTVENVPADVQGEVTKWLEYFQAAPKTATKAVTADEHDKLN